MSKEYPTVHETIAYDEGFADAEDYWCAKEQDRILALLEEWPICEEGCYCLPCDLGETDALRKEFANLIALIRGEN